MKTFVKIFLLTFALLILGLYAMGYGYLFKGIRIVYGTGHETAFLDDYKYLENTRVEEGHPQSWPLHTAYNQATPPDKLTEYFETYGTVAYLIIKNDSIWYEQYFDGYDESSLSNSFSMAKSLTVSLLWKAIEDGYINSMDEPVSHYIEGFDEGLAAKLTLRDLASMSSGSNWDEDYYSPFSITTRAYYDEDLLQLVKRVQIIKEPGKAFKYSSGDTQMLGLCIKKATGKDLATYLSESFWRPMGAEHEALWQVDSERNGNVKAYCCLASNAKDFARFGKLYKDNGYWNGKPILDSTFVHLSLQPRFEATPYYGYGWWLMHKDDKRFFMMRGHLGQYVIVQPEDDVIIVRLGHKTSPDFKTDIIFTEDIDMYIDAAYEMLAAQLQ